MVQACPTLTTGEAFLSTVLRHLDCQAQALGSSGYSALSDPTSPIGLALTALLTIFIALFGLRMVLGETPTLREGVMAIVKVGVVLLIATSWPAYRTVFYDVVVSGPGQLSAAIGSGSGLSNAQPEWITRLQSADNGIVRLTTLGTGRNDLVSRPPVAADGGEAAAQREPVADDPAFATARIVFLSTTMAAVGVVQLMAGLLLALAPLFAGLLLFEVARGLFVGWVRALIFTVMASVAGTVILSVELTLLEPWLSQVLQLRASRLITASAPIELLVMTLAFALVLAGSLAVMMRLAFTVTMPSFPATVFGQHGTALFSVRSEPPANQTFGSKVAGEAASRSGAIAQALEVAQRRDSLRLATLQSSDWIGRSSYAAAADEFSIPTNKPMTRRTQPRSSAGASIRDRRS